MTAKTMHFQPAPSFTQRLARLFSAIDQGVTWWGEHRAWPANEPIRVDTATAHRRR